MYISFLRLTDKSKGSRKTERQKDNPRDKGEKRGGAEKDRGLTRQSLELCQGNRWRMRGGWWPQSARGGGWIKEHVRACWDARLPAKQGGYNREVP